MPPTEYLEFPLPITILAYTATAFLLIIIALLSRLGGKIDALNERLNRTSRSAKLEDTSAAPNVVEVGSGSIFEQFLNEDTERRSLTKKEQFKAYRKWRTEKGLNWSAKD